jgi:hypothetical protein
MKHDFDSDCGFDVDIIETCRETLTALDGMRRQIYHLLADTLDRLDLEESVLIDLLDCRPSAFRRLLAGDPEDISIEQLISYLEALSTMS